MARKKLLLLGLLGLLAGLATLGLWQKCRPAPQEQAVVSYRVDVRRQQLRFYWQDDQSRPLRSIQRLHAWLGGRRQRLVFATNAGMFRAGNSPLGLFIQDGKVVTPLDTSSGRGNFYLKPNGVFFTTRDGKAVVCRTQDFRYSTQIAYATQSGPMLLCRGRIHAAFQPDSKNLNIRNGVGILPDGRVVFAMSKQKISLYDFAAYFQRLGCQQALYLDGYVSRTYLPEKQWIQLDGDFGVLIGVTVPAQ